MQKNFIINYVKNMTKEDMYKYIKNKNLIVSDNDVDTIFLHIKKYYLVFFDNPIYYIKMLKSKISDNTYYEILTLFDQYKNFLK